MRKAIRSLILGFGARGSSIGCFILNGSTEIYGRTTFSMKAISLSVKPYVGSSSLSVPFFVHCGVGTNVSTVRVVS